MDNKLTIKNNSKSRRGFLQDAAKWIGGTALLAATANVFTSNKVKADTSSTNGSNPYIGEIMMFGGNFNPRGWATCEGQLLQISQNTALFSLLGTTYGGDGRITFGLPDLRGRAPIGRGSGPGLATQSWGERGGTESFTLTSAQMPSHSHSIPVNSAGGTSDNPVNNFMASNSEGIKHYSTSQGSDINTDPEYGGASANSGGGQVVYKRSPYLAIYFCIALVGEFPARN